MLATSDDFKKAIKNNVVKVKAKLVFNFASPITIEQDNIISINVKQTGTQVLGCVQDDKITATLIASALTSEQYGQTVCVDVYFGCIVNGTTEYCCIGRFKPTKWEKTEYEMTVELGSNIPTDKIKTILAMDNVTLSDYIAAAATDIGLDTIITTDIVDGTLNNAYLYYKTVKEQINAFAFATNTVARSTVNGIVFNKYSRGTSVDTYKEGMGELILYKSNNTYDMITKKENYALSRSIFTKTEDKSLCSFNNYLVTDNYEQLDFDFSSPSIAKYIKFEKYSYFNNFLTSLWGGSICVGSGYDGQTAYVTFNVMGTSITSTVLGKNDDNITYISNPYIQTKAQIDALDISIYNGDKYSIKTRINPSLQVGDTITIEGKGDMLVTAISYKFDGSLTGNIEGVLFID